MLVLDTDGAFAFCVFDLRDGAETGIAREEAAERRSVEAAVWEGPLNEFEWHAGRCGWYPPTK